MHIAILDTDIPVPTVYATYGLYSTRFRSLLRAAAARLHHQSQDFPKDTDIHTTAYDTVHGVYPPEQNLRTTAQIRGGDDINVIDAVLITGSVSSVYDKPREPWIGQLEAYIRRLFASFPQVKIFGSCFGHQIIAEALLAQPETGIRVAKCPAGYEVGIAPITLDKRFCEAVPHFVRDREADANGNERRKRREMRLQFVHGDWVTTSGCDKGSQETTDLPEPWLNLGSTAKCPIQGLYYPGRVLTFQGHFEFDSFINRESVTEFGKRLGWDPAAVEGLVAHVDISTQDEGQDDDDDSKLAAEAVVLFFMGRESSY